MRDAKWLGGAFSAYGLASPLGRGKRNKISLMTSSNSLDYVQDFFERAGIGRIEPYKGRWHWLCDDPHEVRAFHLAVGPHLTVDKRKLLEAAWETWRGKMLDATNAEIDPGPIDGEAPDPEAA